MDENVKANEAEIVTDCSECGRVVTFYVSDSDHAAYMAMERDDEMFRHLDKDDQNWLFGGVCPDCADYSEEEFTFGEDEPLF